MLEYYSPFQLSLIFAAKQEPTLYSGSIQPYLELLDFPGANTLFYLSNSQVTEKFFLNQCHLITIPALS